MSGLNLEKGREPRKNNRLFTLAAITVAVSGALVYGCSSDSSSGGGGVNTLPVVAEAGSIDVIGTDLRCDSAEVATSVLASTLEVDPLVGVNSLPSYVVSKDVTNSSELMGNAGNNLKRMTTVVPSQTPDGTMPAVDKGPDGVLGTADDVTIGDVHPVLVSYAEQVKDGTYALGDGSADIGDPTQIDDMFVSISMDNGLTWKKEQVANTSEKSSIHVAWNGLSTEYPGHSHKPTMLVEGNNILVAWNDKYCPSGNPFDLVKDVDNAEIPYPDDLYKVNGSQGSIDYEGVVAPNGKNLYEVPFSCVWTARGVFVDDLNANGTPGEEGDYGIEWRQAEQLTSGTRDSNKIWIAAEDVGFALTWQEDTEGLRAGKGAGPGEGYSGATTNHGSDIWYSYINMNDFGDVCEDADGPDNIAGNDDDCLTVLDGVDDITAISALVEKPKPAANFAYPVRITNNEVCSADATTETKLYCHALYPDLSTTEDLDDTYKRNCIAASDPVTTGNQSTKTVTRCVSDDLDYMTETTLAPPAAAILDGDTGASRPALKILATNAADDPATTDVDESKEYVAVLVYEETKGLAESDPGVPNSDDPVTEIALEGKAVYFESFLWNQPVTVSAGRVVNPRVPEVTITKDPDTNDVTDISPTGRYIYENARRVVIAPQVDACDVGDYTFGLLFKQGYETRGGPSDMFIVMNTGFTYEDFEVAPMLNFDGAPVAEVITTDAANISSHKTVYDLQDPPQPIDSVWTVDNLDDQSYTFADDNTFSPRAFLRGDEIYTGFEFTSNWRQTSNGTRPNNFWINTRIDEDEAGVTDGTFEWTGPLKVSITRGAQVSTLDPRFVTTPEGRAVATAAVSADATLIEQDTSNPNVLFMSYGTFDMSTTEELDLYYTRSTDKGRTWEYFLSDGTRAVPADWADGDGILGTGDDDVRLAKLAHSGGSPEAVIEKEVQALASPNGTMLFNAWLQETHVECGDPWCGLESRFGLVEYDSPVAP